MINNKIISEIKEEILLMKDDLDNTIDEIDKNELETDMLELTMDVIRYLRKRANNIENCVYRALGKQ